MIGERPELNPFFYIHCSSFSAKLHSNIDFDRVDNKISSFGADPS